MANVYSMSANSFTNNSYSGFVEFLRNNYFTSITSFLVANGVAFYAAGARNVVGVYARTNDASFGLVMTQVENSSYDEGLETTLVTSVGTEITENIFIIN